MSAHVAQNFDEHNIHLIGKLKYQNFPDQNLEHTYVDRLELSEYAMQQFIIT